MIGTYSEWAMKKAIALFYDLDSPSSEWPCCQYSDDDRKKIAIALDATRREARAELLAELDLFEIEPGKFAAKPTAAPNLKFDVSFERPE